MKNEKMGLLNDKISAIFVDLGKLSFGGLLIGSVLRGELDPIYTLIIGAASAIFFISAGVIISLIKKE